MSNPIKYPKSEIAYYQIRQLIDDFKIMPGQGLCIKDMSEYLQVSTTPIREALFGLEREGYVIRNINDAFYAPIINKTYLCNLFCYGNFLFNDRITPEISYKNKNVHCNSGADTSNECIKNIDALYQNIQESHENEFIHKQMNVFRRRTASIRKALKHSNKEVYRYIYNCGPRDNNTTIIGNEINTIYKRKIDNCDTIARSVMSYAIENSILT